MKLPADYTKLTWQERKTVREQYIKDQDGDCFYCHEQLRLYPPSWVTERVIDWSKFPKNFLQHNIHLQHTHDTNMTEGAVHAYCNAVMWQYEGR